MALTVTTANTNNLRGGARNVMRSPSGIPYVVLVDATEGGIEVWKGNGVTPTAFSEQHASGNPQTAGYGCVSAAMDSAGVIHIAYMYYNAKVSQLRYVTFSTAMNTFSGDVAVKADIGNDPSSLLTLYTAIAVDGNDVPHVAYSEYPNKGGLPSLFYKNRIGGAWNSAVLEIEGATNGYPCSGYDLAIDLDNRPVVSYIRMVLRDFEYYAVAAIGNTNDPTGWTLYDLVFQSAASRTSIVVDPSGNHYVLCGELSYPRIYRHNHADNWTTWTTIPTSNFSVGRSLSWSGNNLYFFYESSAGNVCYRSFNGAVWSDENVLEAGTFNTVKSRWGFWVENGSAGALVEKSHTLEEEAITPSETGRGIFGVFKVAQSFRLDHPFILSRVGFNLSKYNAPSGTAYFRLYAHSGTYGSGLPTGSPLAEGSFDVGSMGTGGTWIILDLQPRLTLEANTPYFISFEFSGGDSTNNVIIIHSLDRYGGNPALYSGSSWAVVTTFLEYKLYGLTVTRRAAPELDYVFLDETATPDLWWNSLALSSGGWSQAIMKAYIGGTWVTKPLKAYVGGSWIAKPLKHWT